MMPVVNQYEIVLVNLDPTIGCEMKKTRPFIVLSPNEMNKYLQTIVVAPVTNTSKAYPTRVLVKHKKLNGWIVIDQIRTIDRKRVVKHIDVLSSLECEKVKAVLRETFVD